MIGAPPGPDTGPAPVEIGTAIVSYIEPRPGQAVAFNRWYERDHFPATVKAGPGVFAAARFVATRACKELRPPGRLFGDPARGSYLAIAWVLPGKQPEWDEWVGREMQSIAAQDRLFAGRDHVHTAVYRCVSRSDPLAAFVALDRGPAGAILVAGALIADEPIADEPIADEVLGASAPVRVGLRWERTIVSEVDAPPHDLTVGLGVTDPLSAFTALAPAVAGAGFAGPFLATVPGTDTYTDQL